MTSTQIRQSFLDFFKSKQHSIVPSASLMPDSPNLLFTNAGMNQFVPIFLGQKRSDVSKWAGAIPRSDTRAADTQKCIRAGGKHNDLDDVGLDTYHHTFFEMLGNWSFGDYFKREAIEWAWELVVDSWKFPANRLYATVFCPYLGQPGWEDKWRQELEQVVVVAMTSPDFIAPNPDASPFEIADQEAAMYWAQNFRAVGLDPFTHVVPGNKNDNFWMMGETGPCGPCSELHVDLTPAGDTKGSLVNQADARCIEIWNLVFIQFNAEPGNRFSRLPARHVDTGMGFERVTSIIQGTKDLKDFANAKISNYETDIFRPIFNAIEKLSGKKYRSTLPPSDLSTLNTQHSTDIAFRVIADHIRTLSFAITDGISPGNNDRNYVLRRILRRAVRYGRTLGFHEPFFYKLVDVLADTMGDVFPEIRAKKKHVQEVIRTEEEAFNKTLDKGLEVFEGVMTQREHISFAVPKITSSLGQVRRAIAEMDKPEFDVATDYQLVQEPLSEIGGWAREIESGTAYKGDLYGWVVSHEEYLYGSVALEVASAAEDVENTENSSLELREIAGKRLIKAINNLAEARIPSTSSWRIGGKFAFVLYDTYGFPLDLTELMARERGLTVDKEGFEKLMEEQRARARAAQKKEVISVSQVETNTPTKFVGFDKLETQAKVLEVIALKDKTAVILDTSACYAEMGGQVGDTGEIVAAEVTRRTPNPIAESASLPRRLQITNTQKSGNTWLHFVEGENFPAIGDEVVLRVDSSRRNAIQRHHTVTHLLHWALHEVVSKEASQRGSFVGPDKLTFDFNSAPLTPTQVADIEKLVNERILENAGVNWTEVPYADVKNRRDVMQFFGDKYGDTVRVVQIGGKPQALDGYSMELCGGTHTRATGEIGLFRIVGENAIAAGVRRIEAVAGLTAFDAMKLDRELIKAVAGKVNSPIHELEKKIESLLAHEDELQKEIKRMLQRRAWDFADKLKTKATTINGIPAIIGNLGGADTDFVQCVVDAIKGTFQGVIVLGGVANGAVSLVAAVTPDFIAKVQAGKIIQAIAPMVGGKGGGKPDNARGGGKDASKLDEALAKVKTLF